MLATQQIRDLMPRYRSLLGSVTSRRHEEPGSKYEEKEHLAFMCDQITDFCASSDRREKTMRWLGWLQAKLHSAGLLSMEQCKRDLMSPDATFEKLPAVEGVKS